MADPTIDDVRVMMPIITPYNLPEGIEGDTLYDIAIAQMGKDNPSISGTTATRSACYYVAYLQSAKEQRAGVSSESLGEWSVSYSGDTSINHWLQMYRSIITPMTRAQLIASGNQVATIPDADMQITFSLDGVQVED